MDRGRAAYRYTSTLSPTAAMLEKLLKTSEIQELFESFYKLIKIPLAIIDLDANVLLSSRWQRICMEYYRVNPTTCARCLESDRTLTSQMEAGRTYAMSRCPNGLTDCASPIVFDGQQAANVFIGEFLTEKPDVAWFARQAEEFGFDKEDFLAALAEVPIVEAATIPNILDLLSQMTRVITNLSIDRKRALDERTRQKLILDTIPQAVFWKDTEGRYLGCNAVFAEAAGVASSDEVVGKTDFDLPWASEFADAYRADDHFVVSTGNRKLHIIEEIKRSDGSRIVADTSKIPLAEAGEPVYGVLGVYSDITEQVRAEESRHESEERFRTAFMAGTDAYVIVGRDDGLILEINDRFLEMYGYTREECVGRTSLELGVWGMPEQRAAILTELKQRGRVHDFEVLGRRKDGKTFPVLYSVSPLYAPGGLPLLFGAIHDLTEQYRANEELKRSQDALLQQNALFRTAFVTGSDAYVLATVEDGRILECGHQFLEMFGLDEKECIGRTTMELGIWAKPEQRAPILSQLKATGRVQDFEVMGVRRGGETFHVSYSATRLDVPGGPPLLIVALRDITERKAAEERIRALTRLLRTITEVNELIVREHDRERLLAEACRILVDRGEMRMTWIGVTEPESGRVRPVASAGVDDGYLLAADIRFDDSEHGRGPTGTSIRERRAVVIDNWQTDQSVGPWRDAAASRNFLSSAAFPLEMRGRVVGALTTYSSEPGFFNADVVALLTELAADISYALNTLDVEAEKRAAERALHESEERFRRIVETSAEGIWVVGADDRTAYVNRRTAEILGCEPEDLVGHEVAEFVSTGENSEDVLARDGRAGSRHHRRFRRKDGQIVECAVSAVPMYGDQGEYCGSFAMLTDVTERMASERQVRRLAAVVEELTEAIVITDPRGTIAYTNPAFTKLTGQSREDALGRNWFSLIREVQPKDVHEDLIRTIERGEPWQGFLKSPRRDGVAFEEEVTISPVHDAQGTIINFVAVRRDVTKERSLVAQLNQAQKMEAVGTLAGGVAHDFNNLLQGMLMMLQVAKRPDKLEAGLSEIEKLVRRGSALTRQLLLFSRKEVAKPELLDLNTLIRDASKLLQRLVRENISFTINLAEESLPVTVDRSQLEQAVMNLVVNAADSMPGGGFLRIVTASAGDRCVVSVEDSGHGIPLEIRDRVFEPFFTTKGREKGTGLGLPVVHGIVMEHQGTIVFEDRPGGGTRFTISLPRVTTGKPQPPASESEQLAVPRGGGERVLVVEDEESVRTGIVALLESLGYRPTAVGSGEAALELPDQPSFDIVLSDVVLSGRSGPEVASELLVRWPRAKVVLMSGYMSDPSLRAAVTAGELTLLEKPFDAMSLAAALHQSLGVSRHAGAQVGPGS